MIGNTLILVVPCFNEEDVLPDTTKELTDLLKRLIQESLVSEESRILYVNDGSKDFTWKLICQYHRDNPFV